jgi:hypothetical protein
MTKAKNAGIGLGREANGAAEQGYEVAVAVPGSFDDRLDAIGGIETLQCIRDGWMDSVHQGKPACEQQLEQVELFLRLPRVMKHLQVRLGGTPPEIIEACVLFGQFLRAHPEQKLGRARPEHCTHRLRGCAYVANIKVRPRPADHGMTDRSSCAAVVLEYNEGRRIEAKNEVHASGRQNVFAGRASDAVIVLLIQGPDGLDEWP